MDRRQFLKNSSIASAGLITSSFFINSCNEYPKKLGIALVGLGKYSTEQLAPALQKTSRCYLAAIVSGTEKKRNKWSDKYNIQDDSIYTYETFDKIKENKKVDIVYVVLPNALHKEYVVRAAQAGKHVICEKPMGISSAECQEMIDACKKNGVKLSIGYRLHYDLHHQNLMTVHQRSSLKFISAELGYVISDSSEWRMKKGLAGGGAMMNLGIYCIQAACYVSNQLPFKVTAQSFKLKPDFFKEVEETITFQLYFRNQISTQFTTSHNIFIDRLVVSSESENFELSPAFKYSGLGEKYAKKRFKAVNQQALQMDDFSHCIMENSMSRVSGEMGLSDLRIIEAVYESVESGKETIIQHI